MKLKARIFDFILFFAALAVGLLSARIAVPGLTYWATLLLYWIFSTAYYNLRIITRSGNSNIDYGITYTWSFGMFTGPLGVLIFECIYRTTIYLYKKCTGTADPEEGLDTFYNIGSYAVTGSICYYLYAWLGPVFERMPFGYWILVIMLFTLVTYLSTVFLIVTFSITGDIRTSKEAMALIRNRNAPDLMKVALTNGLLFVFLQEGRWDVIICLFVLNYIVSLSFYSKNQSVQNKSERDKFEQMAYRDFLTGVHNRAYMDMKMEELDRSGEYIGIVVGDIDKFKKINDNYNHAVGDQVIRHFSGTLSSRLLSQDYMFRSGGQEFTIFLRGRSFGQCRAWVEDALSAIGASLVEAEFREQPARIAYTASFGLYYFKVGQSVFMEKGYIYADQLLLESKRLGRNRVTAAEETAG